MHRNQRSPLGLIVFWATGRCSLCRAGILMRGGCQTFRILIFG